MKTVIRHALRFSFWWVFFFIVAHSVTIFAVSATLLLDPTNSLYGWGATIALPLLSLLFARGFFRKISTMNLAEVIELSLAWGIFYALASAFLGPFFYGIPWQMEFTNAGSVVVDMLIFGAFFLVGYRACVMNTTPAEINLLEPSSNTNPSQEN